MAFVCLFVRPCLTNHPIPPNLLITQGLTLITISSPSTYSNSKSNDDDNDSDDVVPVITVLILSLLLTSIRRIDV